MCSVGRVLSYVCRCVWSVGTGVCSVGTGVCSVGTGVCAVGTGVCAVGTGVYTLLSTRLFIPLQVQHTTPNLYIQPSA